MIEPNSIAHVAPTMLLSITVLLMVFKQRGMEQRFENQLDLERKQTLQTMSNYRIANERLSKENATLNTKVEEQQNYIRGLEKSNKKLRDQLEGNKPVVRRG